MMKIAETVLAASVGIASVLSGIGHAQSQLPVKNNVLVHGAFADGTNWGKVTPILEARGFQVVAVQNPLKGILLFGLRCVETLVHRLECR